MQLPDFRLERYLARFEFNAPYVLCASDCETLTVGDLLAMEPGAADALNALPLHYTEPPGGPALRAEIARLYEGIEAEDILVFSGAEEAIFIFMNAALSPGDHIIVHSPCYQALHEIARAVGCEVTLWETEAASDWELDLAALRRNLRPNTKAVVVNCPHNPTGYQMSQEIWRELVALSQEHGFLLFSDEVYRGLEYREEDQLPALCEVDARGVSLGVLSKTFGLPGLRIGWIATRNRDLYRRLLAFKDYTTICNSAPSEFLGTIALRHKQSVVERNRAIIRRNLTLLDEFFAAHADIFDWKSPKAGPIAFPGLTGGRDVNTFCEQLVAETGVLLLPGTVYAPGLSHVRVGFGRENLPECIAHLKDSSQLGSGRGGLQ